MMVRARLPLQIWEFSFISAMFLINRIPSWVLCNKYPYQLLYGIELDYSMLRVLGYLCFPHVRPYSSNKLEAQSIPCIFLGSFPLQRILVYWSYFT